MIINSYRLHRVFPLVTNFRRPSHSGTDLEIPQRRGDKDKEGEKRISKPEIGTF